MFADQVTSMDHRLHSKPVDFFLPGRLQAAIRTLFLCSHYSKEKT